MLAPPTRASEAGAGGTWVRPLGLLAGKAAAEAVRAGRARWLAGGPVAFTLTDPAEARVPAAYTESRAPWAGFALDRPLVMGIVNVTPDSFSDGGDFADPAVAVRHARALLEEGADIIDVGGESTRPGAAPTPPEEEARRVVPVVRALAEAGAVVSIDTRRAAVMQAALEAGARIVNDVTGLTGDPESLAVAAAARAPVVLMHMRGEPATMQSLAVYDDVVTAVADFLAERIEACRAAGLPRERIVVDPGIGFAKTGPHNLELLARLGTLHGLGCALLLGASRKSFIGRLARAATPKDRLPGSLAAALIALQQGVHILRVHDVAATRQAVAVWQAIVDAG
jgi:dihydropteroate synthase